jgi:hypothetical protein
MTSVDTFHALLVVRDIAGRPDPNLNRTIEHLGQSKRLSSVVHELNKCLLVPGYQKLAASALKRLWLEYAG